MWRQTRDNIQLIRSQFFEPTGHHRQMLLWGEQGSWTWLLYFQSSDSGEACKAGALQWSGQARNPSAHPARHQLPAPELPPVPPIHHLVSCNDAAPLQSEPFFNIFWRKGRRKQKDHLLPLIEKQDRKTDKPKKIGTIPQTSTDPREKGDDHGIKNESLPLLLPCDSSTRLSLYTSHPGTENLFITLFPLSFTIWFFSC